MKKYVNIALGGAFALIIGLLFLVGGRDVSVNCKNPEFNRFVSAYTTGILSKSSVIQLKLVTEVAEKIKQNNLLLEDLFEISPNVEGTFHWADLNTIEFVPTEYFEQNTHYVVNFKLHEVEDVSDELEYFSFDFHTIKQQMEVVVDNVETIDFETLGWQMISGTIKFADIEKAEKVKNLLQARQNGKDLNIRILSEANSDNFIFQIDSVQRGKEASLVEILWDGADVEVDNEGTLEVEIPSTAEFKIMKINVQYSSEQKVTIQFSDPLLEQQDLSGLVRVGEMDDIRYVVENNLLILYPAQNLSGTYKIKINEAIKNIYGNPLANEYVTDIVFENSVPAIRWISTGTILPTGSQGMVLPFEAINLKAVDVTIIKIYEQNVTQFLQSNDLAQDNSNMLKTVGRPVVETTVSLENQGIVNYNEWNRFALDLNELIEAEPGAIYNIELNFRPQHSLYDCGGEELPVKEKISLTKNWDDPDYYSYWDYYEDYYWDDNYWTNRENPCHVAFYNDSHRIITNILASNIGLIAKQSEDGKTNTIFVTDLLTAKPISNAKVEILNFQQIVIKTLTTNAEGIVEFIGTDVPYFVVAKYDKQSAYLKLRQGSTLSLSQFDVSGNRVNNGLKGFLYGERGVWRPGDSIFVTFILEETAEALPAGHPIVFELSNPMRQTVVKMVTEKNSTGFYTFRLKTSPDAPTGNWLAKVIAGGAEFTQRLKIETIKPNRLKINFDFLNSVLQIGKAEQADMNVTWLHGAVAHKLKYDVEVFLTKTTTTFDRYADYVFDDPTKSFYAEPEIINEGKLDENGKAIIEANITATTDAPGMLSATFITKVYEQGGDFSIDKFTVPYAPYETFVGIRLPQGDVERGMLLTDTTHLAKIVTLNPNGTVNKNPHEVIMRIFKLDWRWWWDNSDEYLYRYSYGSYAQPIDEDTIITVNGEASWKFKIKYPEWGRYMVYAYDVTSGHSTAKIAYVDWPGWAGRAREESGEGAAMLAVTSDKEAYNVGETAIINIPSPEGGRALVSIENGSDVLETYWVETKRGTTEFKLKLTKDMAPNVYASVTLLQPHAQTANDLPIRMYGMLSLGVEDPQTHIQPVIKMPEKLEAESEFTIKVSEQNNSEMTYTIAVVDEGLLGLTRYKTPNPWDAFYAKEALGVKTWDMYDQVIGAFSGKMERLLNIGGDDGLLGMEQPKANRFEPVVRFYGPFTLKSGENSHTVRLPRYVGAVRVMVIAGNKGAYGSAEKSVPVVKPLMAFITLPRVLSSGDVFKMPVTLFTMDDNITNVDVKLETNNLLIAQNGSTNNATFNRQGEKTIYFDLKVADNVGIGKVKIIATSGNYRSELEVEIDVRNPNSIVTMVESTFLEAGASWNKTLTPPGISGTNKARLEVSSIPPIDLQRRLNFLITYPHGCIEQTTSGAFPQLALNDVVELSQARKSEIEFNIKTAIKSLESFQLPNGGLSYWPGQQEVSEWGTNYAGHFIVEAKNRGYTISANFLRKWINYQKSAASAWSYTDESSLLIQAYRLYTLALAGEPQLTAMNRLKEISQHSQESDCRLAAAYQITGKPNIAQKIMERFSGVVRNYAESSVTFGSALRDKAMYLEVMTLMERQAEAFQLVKEISLQLGSEAWYNTQATAFSLVSLSKYLKKYTGSAQLKFSYSLNNASAVTRQSSNQISIEELAIQGSTNYSVKVENTSRTPLYVRVIQSGQPAVSIGQSSENGVSMQINYFDTEGNPINITSVNQGDVVVAEVTVKNTSYTKDYEQLALTQIFPSGFEIFNTRFLEVDEYENISIYDYLDIRDDRVMTYFSLPRNASKTFSVMLNASYRGRFYFPETYMEAMYDATINARQKGLFMEIK